MQVKQISKRLERVASFVPQGARLVDVGSDHAYLPIYLVKEGRIDSAIAGEVVQGPYDSARKNVAEHALDQQIEVRLANGLAAFDISDKMDTLVIAGMGGRLISEILEQDLEKLESMRRLILQPNNREETLRIWLSEHGFQLVAEEILTESGKIYEILVVERGQMTLTPQELRFGPYLLQEKSSIFLAKWQKELEKLSHALKQIPEKNQEERDVLTQKIQEIKEVLHVS